LPSTTAENQIESYTREDNSVEIQVRKDGNTVWLTRHQLSELFDSDVKTIGKHVNNAQREICAQFTLNMHANDGIRP
jgi:hypothetical protein